jgi:DNA-directed RNA polymerase subunit RPC12/RpoP
MMFSCPYTKCISYNKAYKVPLIERKTLSRHQIAILSILTVEIDCPHCSSTLFPCENCFTLLQLDKQKKYTFCEVCGNSNIVCNRLRTTLGLQKDQLSNIHFENMTIHSLRLIQRLINHQVYYDSKVEELQKLQSSVIAPRSNSGDPNSTTIEEDDETVKIRFTVQLVHKQLQHLSDKEITRMDNRSLHSFLSDLNSNEFTNVHLGMLQSLYSENEVSSIKDIIDNVKDFFAKFSTLMECKKDYYCYDLAVRNEKYIEYNKMNNQQQMQQQQDSNIPVEVLKSQRDHLRNRWISMTQPYVQLLSLVNQHLSILFQQLISRTDKTDTKEQQITTLQISTIPFSEDYIVLGDIENQDLTLETLKNKITLLRKLCKQLSVVL